MSRRRSAIAAVTSSVWSASLSLAVVPIYIGKLGIEAYGLIGVFVTIQTVVQLLDVGLAPAVNREVARAGGLDEMHRARTLLHSLAWVYWLSSLVILAVLVAGSGYIATAWLGSSKLPRQEIRFSLEMMAVLIAARWPIALYQSAAIGAGRLLAVSLTNMTMNTLSVAGAVAVVTLFEPKLHWMFASQAAISVVHALIMRHMAWRALGPRDDVRVDLRSLRDVWQFSTRMALVALTGVALTQLDKTVLSKVLPLAVFGEYMLAVTVVGGLAVLVTPLFNTIYPELCSLVARGKSELIVVKYYRDTAIFAAIFLPIVATLALHATDIIWLWTGRYELAVATAPIVALLCVGSAINGMMYLPYAVQLAYGLSWMPLAINSALLVVFAPMIVLLSKSYGGIGGAAAWAALEVFYLVLGTYLTHRHVRLGRAREWFVRCVAPSIAATAAAQLACYPLIILAAPGSLARVALIGLGALASVAAAAMTLPEVRAGVSARLNLGADSKTKPSA